MSKRTYLQQRVKVKAHFYYSLHESVHKLLLFYNSATASNKIIKFHLNEMLRLAITYKTRNGIDLSHMINMPKSNTHQS